MDRSHVGKMVRSTKRNELMKEPSKEWTVLCDELFTGDEILHDTCIHMKHDPLKGWVIASIGPKTTNGRYDTYVKNHLIMPGVINAHSHAFQRALRGRTETIDPNSLSIPDKKDSFWTWRETMYHIANRLTPEGIYKISRMVYEEMVAAGYTTVGEFHYLHHQPDGHPYDDPNELSHHVIKAAKDAGIHLVLLPVAYKTSAPGRAAHSGQKRFVYKKIDDYLSSTEDLHSRYKEDPQVEIGVAAHSIRAVPGEEIVECYKLAEALEMPFHIHACEQRGEVEQCLAAYGKEPLEWLDDLGVLQERTSVIHATHVSSSDVSRLRRSEATVVACPSTEGNLGDGFIELYEMLSNGIPIGIGTDSQGVIDPFEELRSLEYRERLRREERNVSGYATRSTDVGSGLLGYIQKSGAKSLRVKRGRVKPGYAGDLIGIDLEKKGLLDVTKGLPELADLPKTPQLGSIIFSSSGGLSPIRIRYEKDDKKP